MDGETMMQNVFTIKTLTVLICQRFVRTWQKKKKKRKNTGLWSQDRSLLTEIHCQGHSVERGGKSGATTADIYLLMGRDWTSTPAVSVQNMKQYLHTNMHTVNRLLNLAAPTCHQAASDTCEYLWSILIWIDTFNLTPPTILRIRLVQLVLTSDSYYLRYKCEHMMYSLGSRLRKAESASRQRCCNFIFSFNSINIST